MTPREKLADALRFGPMAHVMRGWSEPMRMVLAQEIADDLLAAGWTKPPPLTANVPADPRTTDEATGLPALDVVEPASSLVVVAWAAAAGIVSSPLQAADIPVRWLHLRGLARAVPGDDPHVVDWAQMHIAVPVDHALDVAAALAKGTTEELGGGTEVER